MDFSFGDLMVQTVCSSFLTLWMAFNILKFFTQTSRPEGTPTTGKKGTKTTEPKVNTKFLACSVAFLAYQVSRSVRDSGLADLVKGTDPNLDEILRLAPSIARGPSPPLLLQNPHLQFAPWMLQNELHNGGIEFEEIYMNVTACLTKEGGTEDCYRPESMMDRVRLDVFPPFNDQGKYPQFNRSSPVILFEPGLRCHSQDMPGNMIIRLAYEAGFRSIAINRRGHIPGEALKAPRWNLFGDIDDLEQTYWEVKEKVRATSRECMFTFKRF